MNLEIKLRHGHFPSEDNLKLPAEFLDSIPDLSLFALVYKLGPVFWDVRIYQKDTSMRTAYHRSFREVRVTYLHLSARTALWRARRWATRRNRVLTVVAVKL